jgi:hypothetical protein
MEATYWYLLETLAHILLQKVRGYVLDRLNFLLLSLLPQMNTK